MCSRQLLSFAVPPAATFCGIRHWSCGYIEEITSLYSLIGQVLPCRPKHAVSTRPKIGFLWWSTIIGHGKYRRGRIPNEYYFHGHDIKQCKAHGTSSIWISHQSNVHLRRRLRWLRWFDTAVCSRFDNSDLGWAGKDFPNHTAQICLQLRSPTTPRTPLTGQI